MDIFGVQSWTDAEDFIGQVAERTGKLLKKGEPDVNNVCKSIIYDWQRGNIPYFTKPPQAVAAAKQAKDDDIEKEEGQNEDVKMDNDQGDKGKAEAEE